MWILGALLIGFASGVRLPPTRLLLLLGLVHMTLQHARHGDLLAIVGPLALAAPLGRAWPPASRRGAVAAAVWAARLARPPGVAAAALTLALAVALALPTALRPILRADDAVTPAAALAAATRLGLSGPVFNSERFGGYLIFRGVPTLSTAASRCTATISWPRIIRPSAATRRRSTALLARYRIAWTLLAAREPARSA